MPPGRRTGERIARHGTAVPRGLRADPVTTGRFGRMFPRRKAARDSDEEIKALVDLMLSRAPNQQLENDDIPAGFTYLGQFIDHDITFDPTSKRDANNDPRALVNFRTPRYDLDSVYGAGRRAQPYLYDWKESQPPGIRLLVGHNPFDGTDDLPRNQQGRALIGDARNDEHVIIAQLHLLFIRFHNAVVDDLFANKRFTEDEAGECFEEAQRIVRWHYQWIVVHEFLPKVVGAQTARAVLKPGRGGGPPTVHRKYFKPRLRPFIPVEFSGAAYRFGHSMIRNQYGLVVPPRTPGVPAPHALRIFPQLSGFTWLTRDLVIEWERFFEFPGREAVAQRSFLIDTSLATPLFDLPDDERVRSLAQRNLERGRALALPTGQEVARRMEAALLPREALRLDDDVPGDRRRLRRATPLWYYILSEAAHDASGSHLGPVGGRIVAEVLVGLLQDDPSSYLRQDPAWRPRGLGRSGDFTMVDLVKFAEGRP